jgi:aminopeptidase
VEAIMTDPRLSKLAQVLVHCSLAVQPGQLVRVAGPAIAAPLLVEAYREVITAGGHALVRASIDGTDEIFFKQATDEQLRFVSPLQRQELVTFDADLGIWAHYNTRNLTGVDPARQALRREAMRDLTRRFMERASTGALKWVGTQFPTHADAQDAEMSLAEYEKFVFAAGRLHEPDLVAAWQRVKAEQDRMIARLNGRRELRLSGANIDLTICTDGRKWINAAGEHNFPDGEIFTGPAESATKG